MLGTQVPVTGIVAVIHIQKYCSRAQERELKLPKNPKPLQTQQAS